MFFKRLEVFGFKSFAEKTTLEFEAGVSAIVGPNGCGKSNIADSIKWVLGEQSVRSMRGSRMEDVIFHGADQVSPVGFAEVSLTISNQNKLLPLDYEEITITRRIFRSGESEYLINKIPVRLKDILEILMGTGMGMHSYSLMEQGKVDQILSSRPEDRRAIFEEASGITRYKTKKEEALRKLERTQENLQRLGDIIVEVKRQIKAIERQVNKARRYKDEFEKLKEYELKVAQYQFQDLKKKKRQLEKELTILNAEEGSFKSRITALNNALARIKRSLNLVQENISSVQAEGFKVSATISTNQNKISLNKERVEELHRTKEELNQQIETLTERIVSTSEQVEEVRKQIETIEQSKLTKTNLLAEKEQEINDIALTIKDAEKKISEDKTQEVEIITEQIRLKNDLTKLTAQLANLNARMRRLNVEFERTSQDISSVEEKESSCLDELKTLNEELKIHNRDLWDIKSNLDIKVEKKNSLEKRIADVALQISSVQSKLDFLREIRQTYEGFSKGVRSILSARDKQTIQIEGLCDVLANLIQVSGEYQMAIEMALAEAAQTIVVETTQAAYQAINYLNDNNLGRANFVCLDSLSGISQKISRSLANTLGPAVNFVQTQRKYQKVLEHYLANSFIVKDLETAQGMINKILPCIKLVTLRGEVLTRSSISAGSSVDNLDSGFLGREERIVQTEQRLKALEQEKRDLQNLKHIIEEEIAQLSNVIQQKEPQLNQLKIKLANKESERKNIDVDKKRFEDEISILKMEIGESDEQISHEKNNENNLNQKLQDLEQQQKVLQKKIEDSQNLIGQKNQERQNLLVEIAQIKTQLAAVDHEIEGARSRLQMIVDAHEEHSQAKLMRQQQLKDTAEKAEQFESETSQLEIEVKQLSQAKQAIEEKFAQVTKKRTRLQDAISNLDSKLQDMQSGLDKIRKKSTNLQVQLTEINYKQDSLKDKMQQNYQVDLVTCLEDTLEVSVPEDFVYEQINQLKAKLEGMGQINLVAIEENEQLQQRYSFLVSQQEDLSNAQESLRKAITQINRTARTRFAETFQKIQASFKEYFRILFNGGDARIILLDENNILESGIEIVVRPPGKRLQNISLLSGGENALTAIALLFAIFKVKPSPFCILDEVDAPLDESNVDRFTNLLVEFIKTSQFIIITHNKKTINMADVMYGITMERSGISKIVSVKFTDDRETKATQELAQVDS